MKWAIIGLLALAPIWRDPKWVGGKSTIECLLGFFDGSPQKEHITVEEALQECQTAYQKSLIE
jgi:hypothetical protein